MCSPGVLRIAVITELALEGKKQKEALLLFSSNFFYQFSKEVSKTKTTRPSLGMSAVKWMATYSEDSNTPFSFSLHFKPYHLFMPVYNVSRTYIIFIFHVLQLCFSRPIWHVKRNLLYPRCQDVFLQQIHFTLYILLCNFHVRHHKTKRSPIRSPSGGNKETNNHKGSGVR